MIPLLNINGLGREMTDAARLYFVLTSPICRRLVMLSRVEGRSRHLTDLQVFQIHSSSCITRPQVRLPCGRRTTRFLHSKLLTGFPFIVMVFGVFLSLKTNADSLPTIFDVLLMSFGFMQRMQSKQRHWHCSASLMMEEGTFSETL